MPRAYLSAPAQGTVKDTDDEILVSFYGPRGGNAGLVSLSLASAKMLGLTLMETANALVICKEGLHSWVGEKGKLDPETRCIYCGERYGHPD